MYVATHQTSAPQQSIYQPVDSVSQTQAPAADQTSSAQQVQQTPAAQTTAGSLSVSSTNGAAPLTVTFSIQQSAGGQFIDFGDGTNPCSPLTAGFAFDEGGCNAPAYPQTFTHTYTTPGTYKVVASRHFPSTTLGAATITVTGSNQSSVSVPGMSEYTDASFGFSFWYPSGWQITTSAEAGSLVKSILVKDGGGKNIMTLNESQTTNLDFL